MPSPSTDKTVFLVGFMGTGKSTVGALLAARWERSFVDLDERIESEAGATIKELFAAEGEGQFRHREASALQTIAGQSAMVVAVGGGAVTHPGNLKLMFSAGVVVCLRATPETILQRIGDASTRPLLAGAVDKPAEVARLLDAREPFYRQAHFTVDTDGVAPSQVASRIEAELCR